MYQIYNYYKCYVSGVIKLLKMNLTSIFVLRDINILKINPNFFFATVSDNFQGFLNY